MSRQDIKYFKNTFSGGISQDVVDEGLEPNSYRDADNVELIEHGEVLAATNMKGTTALFSLLNTTYAGSLKVLGVQRGQMYDTSGSGGSLFPGAVVFLAHRNGDSSNDQFLVYFIYEVPNGVGWKFHIMYSETIGQCYNYAVDSTVFSENGIDYIYFSLQNKKVGKIPFSTDYTSPTQFTDKDIRLIKAESTVSVTDIDIVDTTGLSSSTGTLFTGTYSFAIRLWDSVNNKYTNWSLLTWPAQVTPKLDALGISEGVIGVSTTKRIDVDFTVDSSVVVAGGYTHYQVASLENIDGTTVPQVLAYLQDPRALTTSQTSYTFSYTSNSSTGQIPIDTIVTELAQIQFFNTVNIKDNIIFGADVTYKNLDYDNGDPAVGSVTYLLDNSLTTPDSYRDDSFASTRRGYFRGEVYRFYISYYDEDFNFSYPKVLDFSGVTGAVTADGFDLKFPDRYDTTYGHISSSTEQTQALGVRFSSITNHPSWAIGYVILRAKREKNILGQAAVVPTVKVEPALQWHGYPEFPNTDYTGTGDDTIEPPDPLGIYVPKIFGGIVAKDIRRKSYKVSGGAPNMPTIWSPNGSTSDSNKTDSTRQFLLYSPEYIYTSAGNPLADVNDLEGATIEPVDAVLLNAEQLTGETHVNGKLENYSAGTFYAYATDYYYNASGRTLNRTDLQNRGSQKLREVYLVPEGGSVVTALGRYGDHESMKMTGYTDGYEPTTQKAIVAIVDDPRVDIAYESMNATVSTARWSASATYKYGTAGTSTLTSSDVTFDANDFDASGEKKGALEIVNITRGLGDTRYGDKTKQLEAMYTGAGARLASKGNPAGVTTDVWGGDCFVGKFSFKISDSNYALVNPLFDRDLENTGEKDTAKDDWGTWFAVDHLGGTTYTTNQPRPIGVHALAETISIYIESEVNTSVDYKDTYRIASAFSEEDSSNTTGGYDGTVGGAYNAHWMTWNTGSMVDFTSSADVSATGSNFGPFSHGSIVNVFTATSAFTDATVTISGTLGWSRIGGTGIVSSVEIEKLNSSNVVQEIVMSDNMYSTDAFFSHVVNLSGTVSLGIGDKLRFIVEGQEDGGVIYPNVTGTLTFALGTGTSVIAPSSDTEYLTPFTYRYHGGYSVENTSKSFVTKPEGFIDIERLKSRIVYSEQKIPNSDAIGFDTFPALNFYDMEEANGKVTKLAKMNGEIYALQESSLAYLPINANVMQTADGTSLSIRSADVIGRPNYRTNAHGSSNIQAVVNEDDLLFFVDGKDSHIYTLSEGRPVSIVEGKMEGFFHDQDLLESLDDVKMYWSDDHKELYVTRGYDNHATNRGSNFTYVYNPKHNKWKSNIGFRDDNSEYILDGMLTVNGQLLFIGTNLNNNSRLRIDKAYDDDTNRGLWFGSQATSSIELNVSPENDFVKTADVFQIYGSSGLKDVEISSNGPFGQFSSGSISLLGTDIEGMYKVKKFANVIPINGKVGQRIRGNTFDVKLTWDTGEKAALKSVVSKTRISNRRI